jgi:hypothetical protein
MRMLVPLKRVYHDFQSVQTLFEIIISGTILFLINSLSFFVLVGVMCNQQQQGPIASHPRTIAIKSLFLRGRFVYSTYFFRFSLRSLSFGEYFFLYFNKLLITPFSCHFVSKSNIAKQIGIEKVNERKE